MSGRWTEEEHDLFLKGLHEFGKNWVAVAEIVKTRNTIQVRHCAPAASAKHTTLLNTRHRLRDAGLNTLKPHSNVHHAGSVPRPEAFHQGGEK